MTEMRREHIDRLQKWADFLRGMPEDLWDYRHWITVEEGAEPQEAFTKEGRCGTSGCAVGWLPHVFPDDFQWLGEGESIWVSTRGHSSKRRFFGLSREEIERIILRAHREPTNNHNREGHVSPADVADVIDKIIDEKTSTGTVTA